MYALFSPTEPWFTLDMLTPGIAVFSGAFAMLYMALLVSRDRATWFLTRLYSSPLTDGDFVLGYALPGILIGAGQLVICWAASAVTGLVAGGDGLVGHRHPARRAVGSADGGVLCVYRYPVRLPVLGQGGAGVVLSGHIRRGLSQWRVDAGRIPVGGFRTFCAWLPFYPAVRAGRAALAGNARPATSGGTRRSCAPIPPCS